MAISDQSPEIGIGYFMHLKESEIPGKQKKPNPLDAYFRFRPSAEKIERFQPHDHFSTFPKVGKSKGPVFRVLRFP